ncbi:MAG: hypothetical protein QHH75_15375 [Bacillota bacterium]|nr:hypothetical protein [Bacillota bacterium]
MRKAKMALTVLTVAAIIVGAFAGIVQAIEPMHYVGSYDLVVPAFDGSDWSGEVEKTTTATTGVDNNTSITGGTSLRTMIYTWDKKTRVTEVLMVNSGQRVEPPFLSGMNKVGWYRLRQQTVVYSGNTHYSKGTWSPDPKNHP